MTDPQLIINSTMDAAGSVQASVSSPFPLVLYITISLVTVGLLVHAIVL